MEQVTKRYNDIFGDNEEDDDIYYDNENDAQFGDQNQYKARRSHFNDGIEGLPFQLAMNMMAMRIPPHYPFAFVLRPSKLTKTKRNKDKQKNDIELLRPPSPQEQKAQQLFIDSEDANQDNSSSESDDDQYGNKDKIVDDIFIYRNEDDDDDDDEGDVFGKQKSKRKKRDLYFDHEDQDIQIQLLKTLGIQLPFKSYQRQQQLL
ncbi:MAG: hypothetical protein EZS28_044773, partial [Streblomastix strix]